ncbi:MAG TPA: response regulator [Opitutaceae bacterium]|nr:response regulator [Opitutaceae bacterium]
MTAKDPYRYFRVEARELLAGLQEGIARLGGGGHDPELISLLLRLAHTLKGAARVVRLLAISDLAHQLEAILGPGREQGMPPAPEQRAELNRLLSALAAGLAAIDRPAAETAPSPAAPAIPAPAPLLDTVRLQVAEVDGVLAGVAGAAGELESMRSALIGFDSASRQARLLQALAGRGRTGPTPAETAARLHVDAADLAAGLDRARQRVAGRAERLRRDLRRLHEDAACLRLIPTTALAGFLEQAVRDAGQALGKLARLEFVSRTSRLDSAVFVGLQQALLHLVRNAVAHGIEPAAARRAAGKAPDGRVRVRVERTARRLRVTCEDDGRGIDTEALTRVARAKGWLPPGEANTLEMGAAIRLLSRGGVTTTSTPTEMSGRGVGLETVRAALARLGGDLRLASTPGAGTTATLDLPVSLSALEVLAVETGSLQVLLPLDAVDRVVRAEAAALHRAGPGEQLHLDGRVVPYVELARLVPAPGENARRRSRHLTAVILQGEQGPVAVGVSHTVGVTEAVVHPLPALADVAPYVSGASSGPGGAPRLLLDPAALAQAVEAAAALPAEPAPARPRILVVDDSLTTRMLEQSILESAGYAVDLAVSGEEALQRLCTRRYGLVLVDVEMPGMDGFTLIERLRREPAWRDLPAILVTSRESPADRERGRAAGAQDYVIKGEFDQQRLLTRIAELLS